MKRILWIALLCGCAAQPMTSYWSRTDGLRKSENPWIEQDFRQVEAVCKYQINMAGNVGPDFVYPKGDVWMDGSTRFLQAERMRIDREGNYHLCMRAHGWYMTHMQ